jgi:hypothetical protein
MTRRHQALIFADIPENRLVFGGLAPLYLRLNFKLLHRLVISEKYCSYKTQPL